MQDKTETDQHGPAAEAVPFSSNEIRLTPRQWIVAVALIASLFYAIPAVWQWAEPFQPGADYRIPYSLGDDYWMYQRYCGKVASEEATMVIGDSVIWGHYVGKEETLSHYLSEQSGGRFLNLGVDGVYPAAMAGLIEYYGGAIAGKSVILQCNPLWMSSKAHDLQDDKRPPVNHPKLLPQFFPPIPGYKEPIARRLSIVVERNVGFFGWVNHVRTAYFGNSDFYAWSMEHPYGNPLAAVTLDLASAGDAPSPPPTGESWTERGIKAFSPAWVELDQSLQWRCFRQAVQTLRSRGNRVFVVVGPFNERMLRDKGLRAYQDRKAGIAAWLEENAVPHHVAAVLPSDLYADASHPLRDGYARLARAILADPSFRAFQQQTN